MSYQLVDKYASGAYGKPHPERTAVAGANSILVDISAEGIGMRSNGKISLSFLAGIMEQLDALSKNGKNVILVHGGQPGLGATMDALAQELGLPALQLCTVVEDFQQAEKVASLASSMEEALGKKALVAVQTPAGCSAEVAKACKVQLVIFLTVGGAVPDAARSVASHVDKQHVVVVDATIADAVLQVVAGLKAGDLLTETAAPAVDEKAAEARSAAVAARSASRQLQSLPTAARQAILERIAVALENSEEEILAANKKDIELSQAAEVEGALMQRLKMTPQKIQQLAAGVRSIAAQEEPIRKLQAKMEIAEGLVLQRVSAPIGVLLIIFESRPDALPQIASLAIRSGNGLLLKGGKEATHSNACLHRIITGALEPDVAPSLISLVTSREGVDKLLSLDDVIDLVIPRGSNSLVRYIQTHTKIPVLGHADGICHIYVDPAADMAKACSICVDSKIDYPAACNAVEKILVHKALAGDGRLTELLSALKNAGVTVYRGDVCAGSQQLDSSMPLAPSPRHEYGTLEVTVEIVEDIDEAIDHLHAFGSGHTECIITEDDAAQEHFLRKVDSACINHNASTRFSDGFRFGLGAEVGISTSRIHARGPVGVEGLLTTRWLLKGHGQIVNKDKGVTYTHKALPLGEP